MFQLLENFDAGVIYPLRTYERHHLEFSIDGKEYKADYYDGEIHWLNPHPKQDVNNDQLSSVETEIHEMLADQEMKDETESIDIQPMMNKSHKPAEAHLFKLKIRGSEFEGICRDETIEWSHPRPEQKLEHDKVNDLEDEVRRKIKTHKKMDS